MSPAAIANYVNFFTLLIFSHFSENTSYITLKFSVNEKQVQNWKKGEDALQLTKKSRKANKGHHEIWPDLENQI